MKKEINYADLSDGDVTVCRSLCDRLMAHQAAQTRCEAYRAVLGAMNFENRLLPAFSSTAERQLLVAYDGARPIGYVFSTAEVVTPESRDARPPWAEAMPRESGWLYPDWMETPVKVGDLNNLYVLPDYRGLGVGQRLMERAMAWLRGVPDVKWLFVDVANGNDVGAFYRRYGFRFSHTVLGGLIDAYVQPAVPEK